MKRVIPTPDQKRKMEAMYILGNMTIAEMEVHLPFSRKIIAPYLKSVGIRLTKGNRPTRCQQKTSPAWKNYEKIIRMYRDNKIAAPTIAERFGTSRSTIRRILIAHGIKLRGPSEAHKLRPKRIYKKLPWKRNRVTIKLDAGKGEIMVSRKATIPKLSEQGLTIDQIAEVKGMTRLDVYKELSS